MKVRELTNIQPLIPLLDITIEQEYFDLHNDYLVKEIKHHDCKKIEVVLKSEKASDAISIEFVDIVKLEFSWAFDHQEPTLINFARGEFGDADRRFSEDRYYFLETTNGFYFDIVCKACFIRAFK